MYLKELLILTENLYFNPELINEEVRRIVQTERGGFIDLNDYIWVTKPDEEGGTDYTLRDVVAAIPEEDRTFSKMLAMDIAALKAHYSSITDGLMELVEHKCVYPPYEELGDKASICGICGNCGDS